MKTDTQRRIEWIDGARALAVLFVLLGHQLEECIPFFVFTSPIKIPLFFIITGYVFKERDGNTVLFMKSLFFKLIIPWLFLSLTPVLLFSVKYGFTYFVDHLSQILIGNEIWYMPCCIIAEIIWFFISKFAKRVDIRVGIAALISISGYILGNIVLQHSNIIIIAFVSQLFISLGYLYKKTEKKNSPSNLMLAVLSTIYIILGATHLYLYPNNVMDVHQNRYPNIVIILLMIIIGCYVLLNALKKCNIPRPILFIGQNTMIIYILASYPIYAYEKAAKYFGFSNIYVNAVIGTLIAVITCCVIAFMLNMFCPVLIGRRRRK